MKTPLWLFFAAVAAAQSVPVAHNDLYQSSANLSETILTPTNVASGKFGKLGTYSVSGYIFAQPLYVPSVTISGHVYNLLIVATLANDVYAFDADRPNSSALWNTNLGAVRTSYTGCCSGDTFIYSQGIGILSTPVVDRANGVLYVTNTNATPTWVLNQLSLTTGSVLQSTTITGQFPGSGDTGDPTSGGNLVFFPTRELQRPGLILANSKVYIAFGGVGDNRPWHGWIFAYNTADLSQAGVFCTTPSSYGGSVWQSGGAPAIDASGNVYVTTGNDNNNGDATEHGESVLKLSPTLTLLDWFTPSNFMTLDADDAEVSSNWPVLIPGTSPQLVVAAGKDFNVYLIDTTCMGHLQGSNPSCSLQTFKTNGSGTITDESGSYGSAFANNLLYLPTTAGSIYEFTFGGSTFTTTPAATQSNTYGFPGPAQMSVSSNGTSSTILWVTTGAASSFTSTTAGTLRALNTSLTEIWNSSTSGNDTLGTLSKFAAPTIAAGKVFVSTQSGSVVAFGLANSATIDGQTTFGGSITIQ